ncbi:MAG: hypothetical protein JF597_47695 [Streptomyces sp.]|uniref:hypothetical protein n=1 Tax=Streptomyces sp. TaxID=1931 RepID=UPI0025E7A53B|nr:hypothetical protein [Streptomyces sp.]MBW8800971.1 hypothetical protein [Streptomyces sp.]
MLSLRLTRTARPTVHLRRLLVATAATGTSFLLLSALGYALAHPAHSTAALLRLSWCAVPAASTVYLAVAVARTDPAAKPRTGLSAFGLGPARLMAIAALNTALACALGSVLALLVFLHLRSDLTGMPFDGAAKDFLAADRSLPVPAALTLLTVLPVLASTTVALTLRPRDLPHPGTRSRMYGRFGAYARTAKPETFGTYGRFGARFFRGPTPGTRPANGPRPLLQPSDGPEPLLQPAGGRAAGVRVGAGGPPSGGGTLQAPASDAPPTPAPADHPDDTPAPLPDLPTAPPPGLPWGIAVLAAGLAVESYAGVTETAPHTPLPGGLAGGPVGVLAGWTLTALGLILAAPGLTHLCGRLLQAVRPGARRLLAGRVLMAEATRIGRPLGVLCAVASAAVAAGALHGDAGGAPAFGPLTALGGLVVAGCTVATLLTAAVEARQSRAGTTAALLRLGAPATVLRSAAALRAGALLALFGPLTLLIAELAALPLAR